MDNLTLSEQCIIIGLCAAGTMICRFLPFIIFSKSSKLPNFVVYLGSALPLSVFGMLIVYCLKDVDFTTSGHGLAEAIAITVTALIHLYKRNMMLSIAFGTVIYMFEVQLIFR